MKKKTLAILMVLLIAAFGFVSTTNVTAGKSINIVGKFGLNGLPFYGTLCGVKSNNHVLLNVIYSFHEGKVLMVLKSDNTWKGWMYFNENFYQLYGTYYYADGMFCATWNLGQYSGWMKGNYY